MNKSNRSHLLLTALIVLLALPFAALAQETSSSLRVNTYGEDGNPIGGIGVRVTDTRTGSTRTGTTGTGGNVTFSGLNVGGPYTVNITSDTYDWQTVTDINLRLGDTFLLPISMTDLDLEVVVVTATQVQTAQQALGPASTFSLEDLQDYPAINRDIRDVIRADPRIYQDAAFVGAIQCAGSHPRFNSLTVDGVRMNDNFGLNSNGYPTERQPFPYDSLQEVSVELAPFDVHYGGFTACNINAVTKSGGNELSGSAFYDFTNDSMRGDKLEGDDISIGDFEEERYGFSIGGPIIKDSLFFFVAYEKLEGSNLFERGPAGSGAALEVPGISQAQVDEIVDIAQTLYGYDPGGFPLSEPNEDEKYTIRLDWNINDRHRAAMTYNYNDGFNITESDDFGGSIEFSNHFYERGAELNSTTGALFSDWTDAFTTEFRVSYSELDNRQISQGGLEIGEFQIETYNDGDGDGDMDRAIVFLGADDSRHANDLYYETWNYKLAGAYSLDDHLLTFGYELDDLDIFNMFVQHVYTENRFDRSPMCSATNPNGCIEAFRNGTPRELYYGNSSGTGDPRDSAAEFGYKIHTLYLQDEFAVADGALTIVGGVRYDWYESSDLPTENPNFIARQGYTNAVNFDGEDLVQPRLGLTWDYTDNLIFRGGVGLFSGGNPNVWLGNNYQSDGITQVQLVDRSGRSVFTTPLGPDGNGRPGGAPYQDMYNAVVNQVPNSGVNALDPNFKIPSAWKYNVGLTWDISANYQLITDLLYTDMQDSALIVNGTAVQTGTAPDGRPIYTDSRAFNSDYILTNVPGSDGSSMTFSVGLSADYDNGFDWAVGYAYTESEDNNPMTSSVAFSNFSNIAVSDFNNPGVETSNYEIPHRFTFRANYAAYWWGDNRTNFSVFGAANEGRPYSYTFTNDDGDFFGDFADRRHLLYVPTGLSDPNVVFGPNFNTDAFFDFVNASGLAGYAGGIAPRNAFYSGWWTSFDIRIEQELPGFREEHRFAAFVVVRNFCNFINDDWCTLKEVAFPHTQDVVDMRIANGQYVFENFLSPSGELRAVDASLYEIRVGLKYDF